MAALGSETTAAITGKVGVVRRDPMAMLAFCGYNMGDYFAHWLKMGRAVKHPRRSSASTGSGATRAGSFVAWLSENMRVLAWIVERCQGGGQGAETALGVMPRYEISTGVASKR